MTEKRFKSILNDIGLRDEKTGKDYIYFNPEIVDLINNLVSENEQLKSENQELRNELKFDEKQYKAFIKVINEADDLIKSHLSNHYQRKWKNILEYYGVDV